MSKNVIPPVQNVSKVVNNLRFLVTFHHFSVCFCQFLAVFGMLFSSIGAFLSNRVPIPGNLRIFVDFIFAPPLTGQKRTFQNPKNPISSPITHFKIKIKNFPPALLYAYLFYLQTRFFFQITTFTIDHSRLIT